MEPVNTPSPEHAEFDQMCEQVDEFDTLPAQTMPLVPEQTDTEDSELGGLILSGLVSPV